MSHTRFLALATAALASFALLVACGDDDDTTDTGTGAERTAGGPAGERPDGTTRPPQPAADLETIEVRDGAPVGGPAELEFDAGEPVRFRIRSDVADEVHVHGYDLTEPLPAGRAVTVSFPAELEGIFEVELHGSGEALAELQINP
jgi:hypothetical protein